MMVLYLFSRKNNNLIYLRKFFNPQTENFMCPDKKTKKMNFMVRGNDIHYPSQTNHDACYIPKCVRKYSGEPLYILVAHWCLQQKGWIQRKQISEAFHLTMRRASYLISYLRNKTSRVVCVCRQQVKANKVRGYEIYVISVLDGLPRVNKVHTSTSQVLRRRVGNGDSAVANELWNRLCSSRKAGQILKKGEDDDII